MSTAVISLGCVLRVDFGETVVKSCQAHESSDLTPVKFSRSDLKGAQSDPGEASTVVTSLGCALRVDLGETPVKSRQAHDASALTP